MNHLRHALTLTFVLVAAAPGVRAAEERRGDVSLEVAATDYGEFDETGVGFGARVSYPALDWLAVDGGLLFAPGDLGIFSASQTEGLIGARVGPRLGRAHLFGSLRTGFVRFAQAEEQFPCIAIFPPPLSCVLGGGETSWAVNFGGGADLPVGGRGLVRVELGDLMIRYPGPAITRDEAVLDEGFWRHNLRAAVSVGLRF